MPGRPGSAAGRRAGAARGTWLGVLAALQLAGCFLVGALVSSERPLAFPHRLHVEDEGLDCGDCHVSWEEEEEPGMPVAAQCALCHDDLDAEKPPERRAASLFDERGFRAARAGKQSDEILFSHRAHALRADDCLTCHAEVAADDGRLAERAAELRTSMEGCLDCHAARGGPPEADCASCHAVIRAEQPPPSHHAEWKRAHGSFVRAPREERSDRCSLCHQPSQCLTCHQVEPPQDHNNFWRRRGHGLTASMDRARCTTCHDTDSCQRCHQENPPQSHVGAWGGERARHCLACHEPLRASSCGACHSGTPGHEQATPLPSTHLPGMNCRMCHGNGQPLPHVDNGQVCTECHQ